MNGLAVTGYVAHGYGMPRLLAVDPQDPFRRVRELHPDRLTEDPSITVKCTCADTAPTLGTERDHHLEGCPLALIDPTTRRMRLAAKEESDG